MIEEVERDGKAGGAAVDMVVMKQGLWAHTGGPEEEP